MTRRVGRYLLVLLAVAAALGAALAFLHMRPVEVEVARPVEDVPVRVFGLGTVEARVLSEIGFEVGAALAELRADQGDRVGKGAVLARLHDAEQEARAARARARMLSADAAIGVSEAAVSRAQAVLAQEQQANRRKQALVARGTVSEEVAEEAQREEDVAAADLAVAESEAKVARAAMAEAREEYRLERTLLDHHVLHAPYDALVVERHKELGAVLDPGEPLFTLIAADTVWVLAYVDERRAGGLRVGQPATVQLRSLPHRTFRGHVTRIDIESDRVTEERRVYVACDDCPEDFHLGEQAEVLIETAVLDRALLIPETAVDGFDGVGGTVWTVESARLHRRELTFGQRTLDARIEVVDGLPRDALVVVNRPSGLREGRAARTAGGGA